MTGSQLRLPLQSKQKIAKKQTDGNKNSENSPVKSTNK